MSYTLTGTRYIGTGTLPAPVLGYDAVDTFTGNLYAANSSATGWNLIGNVNYVNYGLLPLTGGTVTGNVTGATGWAPNDSPDFTTTARLGGLTLATQADLQNTATSIMNSIASKITSAVSAISSSTGVRNSIAWNKGTHTFAAGFGGSQFTIPLPQYSDLTYAVETDCSWVVSVTKTGTPASPEGIYFSDGSGTSFGSPGTQVDPSTNRTFWCNTIQSGSALGVDVSYLIIAVRS